VLTNNGNGTFTYTSKTGYVGTDTFTYQIADTDGLTDWATVTIDVTDDQKVLLVPIDVKPDDFPNAINPASKGVIPVAILSTGDFDATTQIDRTSLTFGRTGDEDSLQLRGKSGTPNCGVTDVNGDNMDDLVCHFHTVAAGFRSGDTKAILRGLTAEVNPRPFEGTDVVLIVPKDSESGHSNSGFTNLSQPSDVTDDGSSTPVDLLVLITELNRAGSHELYGREVDYFFFDINADDVLSPYDVLLVINFLNGGVTATGFVGAEGEVPASRSTPTHSTGSSLSSTSAVLAVPAQQSKNIKDLAQTLTARRTFGNRVEDGSRTDAAIDNLLESGVLGDLLDVIALDVITAQRHSL
jgi:hypothetical protein